MLTVFAFLLLPFAPRELRIDLSSGRSPMNVHGHSVFRTIHFELSGPFRFANAGIAVSYSAIRQARSWFGYRYGDPDDNVRAVSSFLFVRQIWHRAYAELGTGPMWSNRRVPAATSRFNMNSQIGFGAMLFGRLRAGYRFSHISNGGTAGRNPGLNVHSVLIGTRLFSFGRRSPSSSRRAREASP